MSQQHQVVTSQTGDLGSGCDVVYRMSERASSCVRACVRFLRVFSPDSMQCIQTSVRPFQKVTSACLPFTQLPSCTDLVFLSSSSNGQKGQGSHTRRLTKLARYLASGKHDNARSSAMAHVPVCQ